MTTRRSGHADAVEPVTGIAARPLPGTTIQDLDAVLPADTLDRLGAVSHDVVRIRSDAGGEVFVRAEVDRTSSDGHLLRLGRMLWSPLAANPGDRLEVRKVDGIRTADEVHVRTAFSLPVRLADQVTAAMRARAAVVWPGARLFYPVLPGGGGVVLRVEDTDASPGIIGADTSIVFGDPDPDVGRRSTNLADVGGLDAAVRRLRDLVELPLLRPGLYHSLGVRPPKGVLLHGPPGTGKTLLSRALAAELGANVMLSPATELVGTFSGETEANLRTLFNEAAHHAPSMIVVDELDVIATNRERLASHGDVRAASQLLMLLDGLIELDGVVVIATTNRVDAIDDAFRRPGRFDEEIYVGPPDAHARREILSIHSREMPLTAEAEAALFDAAERHTAGFTGADLMHLAREVGLVAARRVTQDASGFEIADGLAARAPEIEAEDVHTALTAVGASAMRGMPPVTPRYRWDELAGLDELRDELLAAADQAFDPQSRRREGVLLHGPPGNGKSVLVGALADHVGANIVLVDGSTVFTQWLGESEAALRSLFRRAREVAPSVLVLEQVDAIAPRRVAEQADAASTRVLSALLSSVDEALAAGGILVVGVTNRPDLLDHALIRTGRLGRHLEIGEPDAERRRAIIQRLLGGQVDRTEIARLVTETEGWSAADIEARVERMRPTERTDA